MGSTPEYQLVPGEIGYSASFERTNGDYGILHLEAIGRVPNEAYGYCFEDGVSQGKIRYDFMAWIGPTVTPPGSQIDFTQDDTYRWQRFCGPPRVIFVSDAKHPLGVAVPVKGFENEPELGVQNDSSQDLSGLKIPRPIPIYTKPGAEFTVEAPRIAPEGAHINFDRMKLDILDSGISAHGRAYWTFQSIAIGYSIITITIGSGTGSAQIRYLVDSLVSAQLALLGSIPPHENAESAFREGLKAANDLVSDKWEEAELFLVETKRRPFVSNFASSADELKWVTCYFKVGEGAVVTTSNGSWTAWTTPIVYPNLMLGPKSVDWDQFKKDTTFETAVSKVMEAAHEHRIMDASLYYIDAHDDENLAQQSVYRFTLASGSIWAVGLKSGEPTLVGSTHYRNREVGASKAVEPATSAPQPTVPVMTPIPIPVGVAA